MKDEEIVALYWQRSEDAIRQTDAKYRAYLTKIANNILSDAEHSKECVNDTYLAAWNSMPENKPRVLKTYLGKITRQFAIDVFRKKNSLKRQASEYANALSEWEDCLADIVSTEQTFEAKLLEQEIAAFLRTLPEEARRVFIGRYYFFDSMKKIAAYCGISEANVKSILFRTRRKLKVYLEEEGFLC